MGCGKRKFVLDNRHSRFNLGTKVPKQIVKFNLGSSKTINEFNFRSSFWKRKFQYKNGDCNTRHNVRNFSIVPRFFPCRKKGGGAGYETKKLYQQLELTGLGMVPAYTHHLCLRIIISISSRSVHIDRKHHLVHTCNVAISLTI